MTSMTVNVSQGGRIVIPATIRQKMGIEIGDQVLLDWSDGTHKLRVFTRKQRPRPCAEIRPQRGFDRGRIDSEATQGSGR